MQLDTEGEILYDLRLYMIMLKETLEEVIDDSNVELKMLKNWKEYHPKF